MSKYTEVELKDECLAWGNHYLDSCVLSPKQEDRSIQFDKWWAERNKPVKKKIIDLQPLIASGIDCEFGDYGEKWQIGSLVCIHNSFRSNSHYFEDGLHDIRWEKCRPRMNYKMFNNGGECPLPEGFEVKLYWRDSSEYYIDSDYIDLRWDDTKRSGDIIAYEILGLADGYAYPWEEV